MAIRYRNAGFTLLEVLITLVIAGLLISLASLPSRAIRALNWSKPASSWRCYSSPQPMKRTFAHGRLPGSLSVAVTGSQSLKTAPVDRVFIETPGAPPHISAERVIFGAESIAQPVIVTLCKGEICVHIAGSGDGRYRVRS